MSFSAGDAVPPPSAEVATLATRAAAARRNAHALVMRCICPGRRVLSRYVSTQTICDRLNSARLPLEPTAVTVTLSQFPSPWKVASNSPEPSALAVVWLLRSPLAESATFSPGWNPLPSTTSGRCRTGEICGRLAVVAVVAAVSDERADGSWPQPPATSATPQSAALVPHRAAARCGGMALLICPVARPNQGAGEDGAEAQGLALFAEPAELVRVHPAIDGRVLRTRLEVLPDRDDIDAVLAQVAHRVH